MQKSTQFFMLAPVEAPVSSLPEFLDSKGVYQQFGIRQSLLWRLLAERKIKAVSIRKRGSVRGKRLFEADSIRAFLKANVDIEPDPAARLEKKIAPKEGAKS